MIVEKTEVGFVGAFAGLLAAFAQMDWFMFIMFIIVLFIDLITGNLKAMQDGKWNSTTFRKKLTGKAIEIFTVLALMVVIAMAKNMGLLSDGISGLMVVSEKMLIGAYAFKDMYSILENSGTVPVIVKKWLDSVNKTLEGEKK